MNLKNFNLIILCLKNFVMKIMMLLKKNGSNQNPLNKKLIVKTAYPVKNIKVHQMSHQRKRLINKFLILIIKPNNNKFNQVMKGK